MKVHFFLFLFVSLVLLEKVQAVDFEVKRFALPVLDGSLRVNDIEIDRKNRIWLATNKGILLFDGRMFHRDYSALISGEVALIRENGDSVLVLLKSGMIYSIHGNRMRELFEVPSDEEFSDFIILPDGGFIVATKGGGIIISDGINDPVRIKSQLSDSYVNGIIPLSNNLFALATDQGVNLMRHDDNTDTWSVDQVLIEGDPLITSITHLDSTNFLVTHYSGEISLLHFPNDTLEIKSRNVYSFDPILSSCVIGELIFLNTKLDGLKTIRLKSLENWATNLSFLNRCIHIETDKRGNLWTIEDNNYLVRINANFQYYAYPEKINYNIETLLKFKEDQYIFGTSRGLYLGTLDNGELKIKNYLKCSDTLSISSLYLHENKIYAGTLGKGLWYSQVDELNFKQVKCPGCPENIISISGNEKDIWLSTFVGPALLQAGASGSLDDAEITLLTEKGEISYVYKIADLDANSLLVGSHGSGLQHLSEKSLERLYPESIHGVYDICLDDNGNFYASEIKNGLFSFKNLSLNWSLPLRYFGGESIIGIKDVSGLGIMAFSAKSVHLVKDSTICSIEINSELAGGKPNLSGIILGNNSITIAYSKALLLIEERNKLFNNWPEILSSIINCTADSISISQNQILPYYKDNIYVDIEWDHGLSQYINCYIQLKGKESFPRKVLDEIVHFTDLGPGEYDLETSVKNSKTGQIYDKRNLVFSIEQAIWNRTWVRIIGTLVLIALTIIILRRRIAISQRTQLLLNQRINAELRILKSQVNPHFLFNNFNTLIALIEEDKSAALVYAERLTDFYRGITGLSRQNVIDLKVEIELLENFIHLLSTRFGDNLTINLNREAMSLEAKIPPLSLQMLLENCVKHNEISKENPLVINIDVENGFVIIRNRIQPKKGAIGEGVGLKNIQEQYQILSGRSIEIINDDIFFEVKLPLL